MGFNESTINPKTKKIMKVSLRLFSPNYGFDTCEVTYHTNTIGSKQLYSIDSVVQTYRGEPVKGGEKDVNGVISLNTYEEIERRIVEKTQGAYRRGIEWDNKHLPDPKKFRLKTSLKKK